MKNLTIWKEAKTSLEILACVCTVIGSLYTFKSCYVDKKFKDIKSDLETDSQRIDQAESKLDDFTKKIDSIEATIRSYEVKELVVKPIPSKFVYKYNGIEFYLQTCYRNGKDLLCDLEIYNSGKDRTVGISTTNYRYHRGGDIRTASKAITSNQDEVRMSLVKLHNQDFYPRSSKIILSGRKISARLMFKSFPSDQEHIDVIKFWFQIEGETRSNVDSSAIFEGIRLLPKDNL